MSRLSPKFTDQQREAIVRAITSQGRTAPQTVKLAAQGGLGLPPFEIGESTCRDMVAAWGPVKNAQKNGQAPAEAYDLRAHVVRQLDRLKQIPEPSAKNLHEMKMAVVTIAECDRQIGRILRARPPTPTDPDSDDHEPSELMKRLIAEGPPAE